MNNFNTPILLMIFNRPDTTAKVFDEIKKIKPKQLFVAADAARVDNAEDIALVEQTKMLVENMVDWDCEVITLYREKNLGCKRAVSSATTWFFEHVEQGIILEDDCVPDQSFFMYCQELLEMYKDDSSVMHIGGSNFQHGKKRGDASYYFSAYNHIWGWATWKRAWDKYDVNIADFPKFVEQEKIKTIWNKTYIQNIWLKKFASVFEKKVDTWDYQWTYTIWNNGGRCIIPNTNLITNIGFGEDATHTKRKDMYANMKRNLIGKIIHPENTEINKIADEFYNKRLTLRYRIINKLKAYLSV